MNKFIKSIVLGAAASGLLMASVAKAESQIAVVSFQEIMAKIPQTAKFMTALEAEIKDDKAIIAQLEKDIKYYREKKQRDSSLMTEKEIKELDEKIVTLYNDYQGKGKALNDRIAARQNEETNKIVGVIRKVIDGIAAKKDYDAVIEQKSVVFIKSELNITQEVIDQLSNLK